MFFVRFEADASEKAAEMQALLIGLLNGEHRAVRADQGPANAKIVRFETILIRSMVTVHYNSIYEEFAT